jgi:hypothetical protein
MEEEFYASMKLTSGEEIFSLVGISEEEDRTLLILDNPVIIKPVNSKNGRTVGFKIQPWINISDDEMYIINLNNVITMTEIRDDHIIGMYRKFNRKTNKLQITKNMGLISTVDDARRTLEKIYRSN